MRTAGIVFVLKIDGSYVRISGNSQPEGYPTFFHSEGLANLLLTRIMTPHEKTKVESANPIQFGNLLNHETELYDLRDNNHLYKVVLEVEEAPPEPISA